jgi:hypothetical protein
VQHNFNLKHKAFSNAVRSAQIVERVNLEGKFHTLLEGSL